MDNNLAQIADCDPEAIIASIFIPWAHFYIGTQCYEKK